MKMKPFLTPPYLSLFLQIVAVFVAVGSSPIYTPVEDITLTCGSSGNQFNRYDNRTWRGDINSKLSPIGNTSQVREAPPSSSSMATQVPYTTARLSHSEFTYIFNQLTAGPKFIRLYIYPASYPNFYRSKAHFSVKANYFTLLDDFNASATADAYGVDTLYREFCLNIDEEQSLNITFTPSKVKDAYALINGIEIVSMPTHLYYSNPGSAGADYVGGDNLKFHILSTAALEMVHRLNIGGSSGSNTEDTGMYRKWESEDKAYLVDSSLHFSILRQNNSIELNFATIPKYTAPKEVYQSGRSMGMNKTISKSYNLTWEFEVDPFFFHLVRLHFCEFEPNITQYGDLVFQIYIDNKTVEDRADIIQWSGGNGIPVYRDYIVYMSNNEDEKKASLFLALASFQKDWLTSYGDAILNGLEIFKLISSNDSHVADPSPSPIPNSPSLTPRVKSPKSLNKWTPMLAIVAGAVSSTLAFSVLRLLVFRQGWKGL